MDRSGIPTGGLALHDGSGLSRLNLVTPEATVRLLIAMSKTTSAGVFVESLPIAGEDGTLAGRLKTARNRLRAKTGSLTYDASLSGYATAPDGQTLAFAIFVNDHAGTVSSTRLIDSIAALIALGGPAGEENPAKYP
jgi:D-alanyl-D-alanine carboxypeptidase/D-alanyl-D-alanine-endopeptidase (penicillin-binding protein 4)